MTKVAKELVFTPIVRIITTSELEIDMNSQYNDVFYKALEKVRSWTKEEIIDWLFENVDNMIDSPEPYSPDYDE